MFTARDENLVHHTAIGFFIGLFIGSGVMSYTDSPDAGLQALLTWWALTLIATVGEFFDRDRASRPGPTAPKDAPESQSVGWRHNLAMTLVVVVPTVLCILPAAC